MIALFLIPLIGYAVLASQPGMDNSNQQNGSSQSQQQQSSLQQMIQQVLNNLQMKLSQQQQGQPQTLTSQQMQPQQVISKIISDLQGFMQKLSSTGTASTGSVATVTQTVRIPLRTFGDNVVDYIRSHSNELTGDLGNFLKRIIAKHDSKIQKLKGMICEAPKDNNDWGELDVQMTNTTTTMISNVQQQQQQPTPTLQWNQGQQQFFQQQQQQQPGMSSQQQQPNQNQQTQSQLIWQ
jgi:hypothetical protein